MCVFKKTLRLFFNKHLQNFDGRWQTSFIHSVHWEESRFNLLKDTHQHESASQGSVDHHVSPCSCLLASLPETLYKVIPLMNSDPGKHTLHSIFSGPHFNSCKTLRPPAKTCFSNLTLFPYKWYHEHMNKFSASLQLARVPQVCVKPDDPCSHSMMSIHIPRTLCGLKEKRWKNIVLKRNTLQLCCPHVGFCLKKTCGIFSGLNWMRFWITYF